MLAQNCSWWSLANFVLLEHHLCCLSFGHRFPLAFSKRIHGDACQVPASVQQHVVSVLCLGNLLLHSEGHNLCCLLGRLIRCYASRSCMYCIAKSEHAMYTDKSHALKRSERASSSIIPWSCLSLSKVQHWLVATIFQSVPTISVDGGLNAVDILELRPIYAILKIWLS